MLAPPILGTVLFLGVTRSKSILARCRHSLQMISRDILWRVRGEVKVY